MPILLFLVGGKVLFQDLFSNDNCLQIFSMTFNAITVEEMGSCSTTVLPLVQGKEGIF